MDKSKLQALIDEYHQHKGLFRKHIPGLESSGVIKQLQAFVDSKKDADNIRYQDFITLLAAQGQHEDSVLARGDQSAQLLRQWKEAETPYGDILITLLKAYLRAYDATKGLNRRIADFPVITHCHAFLDEVEAQYPEQTLVNFARFKAYLILKVGNADMLAPACLYSGSASSRLFRLWRYQPAWASDANQANLKVGASLVSFPKDALAYLLRFCDLPTLGALARSSKQFYTLTQCQSLWAPRLRQEGLDERLLQRAWQEKLKLKNVYQMFHLLPRFKQYQVGSLGDLQVMCGIFSARPLDQQDINRPGVVHYSALSGNTALVKDLKALGFDLSRTTNAGLGVEHFAAQSGNPAMLKALKALGFALSRTTNDKLGVEHYAAKSGNPAMLEALKALGFDLSRRDNYGGGVEHYAAWSGNPAMLEALKALGFDLSRRTNTGSGVEHFAAKSGNPAMLIALLALGIDLTRKTNKGDGVEHFAAKSGNPAMLEALLALGFDLTRKTNNGRGVEHFAAWCGNPAMLEILLDLGFDLAWKTNDGSGVEHFAAKSGNPAMLEALLVLGFDPLRKNDEGKTAFDCASASDRDALEKLHAAWLQQKSENTATALLAISKIQ